MGEREERRGREDKYEWLGENWPLTLPDKEKKNGEKTLKIKN